VTIFGPTASLLREADITLVNLEGVICDVDLPPIPGKVEAGSGGHLHMPPGTENGLVEVGVDAVSLANNHALDYGEEGLRQCIQTLKVSGISHAGAGKNIEEAYSVTIVERKGFRVGLLSYTSVYVPVSFPAGVDKPGVAVVAITTAYEAPYNVAYQPGIPARAITYAKTEHLERLLTDIQTSRDKCDFLIIGFHWGLTSRGIARSLRLPVELCPCYIADYQEDLARKAIDAGADLVWGHHPHELQGMEIYKGKLICYSLGNFALDGTGWVRPVELDSAIVRCYSDDGKNWRYTFTPTQARNWQNRDVDFPSAEARKRILDFIAFHSNKYGTGFKDQGREVEIRAARD